MNNNFDLNIRNYSLKELLDLFDLEETTITLENLNKAKKKVLSMHPDKSKLSSEYFLFYKKGFDIIKEFYDNNQKIDQEINEKNTSYAYLDDSPHKEQLKKNIFNMKKKEFNETFNQLFEKNMKNKNQTSTNNWFTDEKKLYEEQESGTNINENIDKIKRQQEQGKITKFKGIQTFHSMSGTNMYDDLEKSEEEKNEYITCDPYGALQYEDIRKVHRDETVFRVNENDFDYKLFNKSQKELERIRGEQNLTPKNDKEAQDKFDKEELLYNNTMRKKQYASKLKDLENLEKNKSVLSYFLRLGS